MGKSYGVEQFDLVVMRERVKRGDWSHDEAMRTIAASYNMAKRNFKASVQSI